MVSQTLPEAIQQELAGLAWIGPDFSIKPIRAGAVNHNFCLTAKGERFFLKCFAVQGPARLDRQHLYRLQQQLAALGFAPKPLYLSVHKDFMLEQWQDVQSLMDNPMGNRDRVRLLANRLSAIHDLTLDTPELDLQQDWQFYLQKAGSQDPVLLEKARSFSMMWQGLDKRTFCHHDLSFGHVCLSASHMTLDWEYAARSYPPFDLANAILVNGLSRLESQQLCQDYAGLKGLSWPFVNEQVEYVMPLAEFTNHLWYLAARQKAE